MKIEQAWPLLRPRFEEILGALRKELGGEDVWEDECTYSLEFRAASAPPTSAIVYVSLTLEDAEEHEGYVGKGLANVCFKVLGEGGLIVVHLAPCNYTPDVWVGFDEEGMAELRARLDTIEEALPGVAQTILDFEE